MKLTRKNLVIHGHSCRRELVSLSIILFATSFTQVSTADTDPTALAQRSLGHLEKASSIAVDVTVAEEAVLSNGLKIRAYREGKVALQRTEGRHGFVFSRRGALLDQTMAYDGDHFYMIGKKIGAMAKMSASGTPDEVMDAMVAAGAYLPGRDLLYQDAAEALLDDLLDSHYEGVVPMNGNACHYNVFRGRDVDWHLWVDVDTELPCKYMITSKWMAAAPEFEMTFTNWQLNLEMSPDKFVLTAPEGYLTVEELTQLQPTFED